MLSTVAAQAARNETVLAGQRPIDFCRVSIHRRIGEVHRGMHVQTFGGVVGKFVREGQPARRAVGKDVHLLDGIRATGKHVEHRLVSPGRPKDNVPGGPRSPDCHSQCLGRSLVAPVRVGRVEALDVGVPDIFVGRRIARKLVSARTVQDVRRIAHGQEGGVSFLASAVRTETTPSRSGAISVQSASGVKDGSRKSPSAGAVSPTLMSSALVGVYSYHEAISIPSAA